MNLFCLFLIGALSQMVEEKHCIFETIENCNEAALQALQDPQYMWAICAPRTFNI